MRRGIVAAVAALVLVPLTHAGGRLPLPTRLAHALAVPGNLPADSGAMVVDLQSGGIVFARNPDASLAPASNEKLPVTFAALRELGPAYRFRTELLGTGSLQGGVWHGDLVLKGFGDPTLTTQRLARLARRVAALGIKRVEGRVLGDESWFDTTRTVRGWKREYYIWECPPLSALVVDRDWYDNHYAARPALAAAGTLRMLLRKHGITTRAAGIGRASADATVLASVQSQTLQSVLTEMDRESDNFVAEMLLKTLGAERGGAGTSAAGAQVVRRDLVAAGIPADGVVIADGSGLSLDDRLTARAVGELLVEVWNDTTLRAELWRMLPVAGVSGTLERRMRDTAARGAVRAKTGTTDVASALSGYANERYAFALLQNGNPVSWAAARKAEDRFAATLASAP
jgi:serine-type D-Ala-D-Ala carboxypeptidase/endopeptidase (penicillin-binding protein 4)